MARGETTIDELKAYSRDLRSAVEMIDRAEVELTQAKLQSVLAHKAMVERDYIPGILAFASDVLAKAFQTAASARSGVVPKVERDVARAKTQKERKTAKKKAAKP